MAPEDTAKVKLQAYSVKNWLRVWSTSSDKFAASVGATSWSFDGKFQRRDESLNIGDLPSLSHAFRICEINPHPKAFSDEEIGITKSLRERGKMFWRCRGRNYVCYKSFVDDGIKTAVSLHLKKWKDHSLMRNTDRLKVHDRHRDFATDAPQGAQGIQPR